MHGTPLEPTKRADDARIAVVDDDPDVLRSMARLLKYHGLHAMTYSSAETLLADLAELRPACIVADVAMPGLDGLALQRVLETQGLALPIVFVTAGDDVRTSVEAMRRGAVDSSRSRSPSTSLLPPSSVPSRKRALRRPTRRAASRSAGASRR